MITRASLPFIALALVLPITACSDDDSSASSSSSSGDADPTTGSSTAGSSTMAGTGTSSADTSSGATEASTGAAGLEIAGQWLEEFAPGMGITHVIDETRWDQLSDAGDAIFHVDAYDNAARTVVAQGDAANEFNPELWSRFDWTWDGDALYYCTAVFDAPTAEDALAAPAPDPGDLAAGCSGFPWSPLVPVR